MIVLTIQKSLFQKSFRVFLIIVITIAVINTAAEITAYSVSLSIARRVTDEGGIYASAIGEAAGIPLGSRMSWLFGKGIPATQSQCEKYLVTVKVPIIDPNGNASSMNITCHRKLADEITAAFVDMKAMGFRIKPSTTYCYGYRAMASGTGALSHHSYGVAIDVNSGDNPATYTAGVYAPGSNPYSVTEGVVAIWKSHGFYWGGDWTGHFTDYMHFTYTDH